MSRAARVKWDRIYGDPERAHRPGPSPYLRERSAGLRPGRALVVAMGEGRNALALARAGWRVEGVDLSLAGVRSARDRARGEGLPLAAWVADLDRYPLPRGRYDLVVGVHFLDRGLWDAVAAALAPGGSLIWETFTTAHAAIGRPRSPAFLLEPGELPAALAARGLRVLDRWEGVIDEPGHRRAVARVHARR